MSIFELIGLVTGLIAGVSWFVRLEMALRTLQYQHTEIIKAYLHADQGMLEDIEDLKEECRNLRRKNSQIEQYLHKNENYRIRYDDQP